MRLSILVLNRAKFVESCRRVSFSAFGFFSRVPRSSTDQKSLQSQCPAAGQLLAVVPSKSRLDHVQPVSPDRTRKSGDDIAVAFPDQVGQSCERASVLSHLKDSLAVVEIGFVRLQTSETEPPRDLAFLQQVETEEVEDQPLIQGPLHSASGISHFAESVVLPGEA